MHPGIQAICEKSKKELWSMRTARTALLKKIGVIIIRHFLGIAVPTYRFVQHVDTGSISFSIVFP